jgi:hypothetical protein
MKPAKVTFYPKDEAAKALQGAASKKVSERVNELILKGLSKEKEDQIKLDYEQYNRELGAASPRIRNPEGISSTVLMSARLFTEDEGSNDEDII